MASSVATASKFLPVIDDIYKKESVTQLLDAPVQVDFTGASEVKVLKVSTTGLGDYSRTGGYPKGDVTAVWETLTLTQERGKEFSIDRMDDEEALGMVFGTVTGNFMRDHVIPELDAYRFATYASAAGVAGAEGSLTADTVMGAIDEASREMDASEVPETGRILFVNSELKPVLNQAVTRSWGSDASVNNVLLGYNGMQVVYVPKTRFYSEVTLNNGSTSWGYTKGSSAVDLNFMLVHPQSVLQATKFAMPKIFSPDQNQDKDMWKFQFRLYHDAFVYDNRVAGVYVHKKELA